MNQRIVIAVLLSVLSVLLVPSVLAQVDLEETFVAPDDGYQFSYPSGFTLDDRDENFTIVTGTIDGAGFAILFFDPDLINNIAGGNPDLESAAADLIEVNSTTFTGEGNLIRMGTLNVVAAPIESVGVPGVGFILQLAEGSYGMMFVLGDSLDAISAAEATLIAMLESYRIPGEEQPESTEGGTDIGSMLGGSSSSDDDKDDDGSTESTDIGSALGGSSSTDDDSEETTDAESDSASDTPQSLDDFAGDWPDAVAELQELGLIGAGGNLVFQESRAFFDSEGNFLQSLARSVVRSDVVMAATLEFTLGSTSETESCTLMARIVGGSGTISTFLQVGIDNNGDVFYNDSVGGEDGNFMLAELGLDLSVPHHVLFIAADDEITVYVDGELVFDAEPIQDRSGYYAIALAGRGPSARCEGTNIWVHEAPVFQPGVCEASSSNTVNRRSGPGTNFDRAGTLQAGQTLQVVGQTSDGTYIWYELEDGSWVREDVVNLSGDCGDLPEAE